MVGQFPAGRLQPADEAAKALIDAQFRTDGVKSAAQIVGDRKDVASESGRGIGARVRRLLLQPAAHILRLRLGVEHLLPRGGQLLLQIGEAVVGGQFGAVGGGFGPQRLSGRINVVVQVIVLHQVSFRIEASAG